MIRRQVGDYVVLTGIGTDHPMSRNGWCHEHEYVLYNAIGPGPHACEYDCGRILEWRQGSKGIQVDHRDDDGYNNKLSNLAVSCVGCNTNRSFTPEERSLRGKIFNERDYPCKLCDRMFSSKQAMRGHRRWCKGL